MMASSNETLVISHPPITSPTAGIKNLSLHGRHHSLGTSSIHRVSRRKSVTSSSTNLAAVAQVVKECGDTSFTLLPPTTSLLSKSVGNLSMGIATGAVNHTANLPPMHCYPSPPPSLPGSGGGPLSNVGSISSGGFQFPRKLPITPENGPSALTDGISSSTATGTARRTRRASEGAHIPVGGSSLAEAGGRGLVELKCDKCGKGYKHSSCLAKHLWEHTPEWQITSKLLISKHQQVQLLEAASILVSMKPNEISPAHSTISSAASINESTTSHSSSSSSSSSGDTTPPPDYPSPADDGDITSPLPTPRSIRSRSGSKRYSMSSTITGSHSSSTKLSGSYHSHAPPILSGSVPTHNNPGSNFPSHFISKPHNSHGRQRSASFVNTSRVAAVASAAAEEESLAAAVELLSCSFGTTTPTGTLPSTAHSTRGMLSPSAMNTKRGETFGISLEELKKQARTNGTANGDVVMKIEETEEEEDEWTERYNGLRHGIRRRSSDEMAIDDGDDDDWGRGIRFTRSRSLNGVRRGRSEEDEEGVFGRMEE